jgi:hypothetical protein
LTTDIVPQVRPDSTALNAEHYQTFEMAKEHDGILGGNDIAQIRSYAAYARAQAQAIHKTIAATSGIDDVAAIKAEATETAQTFAKVGIYADQRIGEILRELPKATNQHDAQQVVGTPTSTRQAERAAHIDHHTSIDLQAMAANPEVVQAVLDKAEQDGRIASRKQVLDAIKERDMAKRVNETLKQERDEARRQLAEKPEPEIIEREVVREVMPDSARKRIQELERLNGIYESDYQKLRKRNEDMRKELEQAKLLIGEKQRGDSAQWDIAALTTATNNYLRQYGGKAWAFDQFYRVDETTQAEFVKAINNLAAFSVNLAQMIREQANE